MCYKQSKPGGRTAYTFIQKFTIALLSHMTPDLQEKKKQKQKNNKKKQLFHALVSLAQAAFTEEGLSKLWNELVKDGEIGGSGGEPSNRKEEEEDGQARRSPFTAFLEEWTWGQVCVCGVGSEGEEESISLCKFNLFMGKRIS